MNSLLPTAEIQYPCMQILRYLELAQFTWQTFTVDITGSIILSTKLCEALMSIEKIQFITKGEMYRHFYNIDQEIDILWCSYWLNMLYMYNHISGYWHAVWRSGISAPVVLFHQPSVSYAWYIISFISSPMPKLGIHWTFKNWYFGIAIRSLLVWLAIPLYFYSDIKSHERCGISNHRLLDFLVEQLVRE